MDNRLDDLFGEPISVYTDAQALEDGVLVAVPGECEVNRVTRAVFDHFAKPTGDPALGEYDLSHLLAAITALLAIVPQDGWRTGAYQGKALWLIPNEIGGLSLMFPEDY
jgi:hypothetical protein